MKSTFKKLIAFIMLSVFLHLQYMQQKPQRKR